jgi:ABC-2 type transport system permease protein
VINAAGAFVRRDYLVWTSYRLNALMQMGAVVLTVTMLYFVGRTLGEHPPEFLAGYDTNYTGYLFTSIAFADAWGIGFNMPKMLRDAQTSGTLEVMVMSRFGVFQLLALSTAFPMLQSLMRLAVYALFAVVVFGLWHSANLAAVAVVFVLSLAALACIGLLSAAFTLVVKQGDPIFAIYSLLNVSLTGLFFPRSVLPSWIQQLSNLLPLTHALEGMRRALQGQSLQQVAGQLTALGVIFLACLPLTIWALNWAIRRAKQDGSLVQY